MPLRHLLWLACFLVVTLGGGLSIGIANPPGAWYEALAKPGFTPPNWLFPVAWTILYVLIGIAGWRVFLKGPAVALALWLVQLALNFAWSPTFFGAHRIGAGLLIIALLLGAILAFLFATIRRNRVAAWCFLPYAAWVAYATLLNFALWRLN
ncbi:tryptophan-rich sensory protein [Aureimonas endophytica]|uniref:Tryptophan-rich sensory protein n=1 Tax=Aureimonas endophytica TaxID=2027858 RepID=A0A916ZUS0_9HYPH|nr:TspO/MBR family protein [Aureimonas endophytica]GGE14926.1 tryptophan-rich sensory protein [Aureimonas endophytica]